MFDLSNWFWQKAKLSAQKNGKKFAIELSEDTINIRLCDRKDSETRAWGNYYKNAGIFIEGHIEEIEIDDTSIREGKVQLTNKRDAIPVLKTKAWEKFANAGSGGFGDANRDLYFTAGIALIGGLLGGAMLT